MSARPVRFLDAARAELRRAVDRYDRQVAGLGDEFTAEVEHSVRQIAANPNIGSPHSAGTRRVLVRRFPFSVVYRLHGEHLVIVAVAHQRRRPEYWHRRL